MKISDFHLRPTGEQGRTDQLLEVIRLCIMTVLILENFKHCLFTIGHGYIHF